MLVRKINQDWKPSENPELKVGETIEITDPKQLIVSGMVVGIDDNGLEVSAYEQYGVLVDAELQDFEEFVKMKKATALKEQLEKEQEVLKAELAQAQPAPVAPVEAKAEEAKPATVQPTAAKPTKNKKK